MGAEAVMALMEADESEVPCVVSLDGNQVCVDIAIDIDSNINGFICSVHYEWLNWR